MIKAKQVFFWTSNLQGHGFHGGKPTFFTWPRNIIHYLCCLENFTFLKSVQYIKSYGNLNIWCWNRLIEIFSTEKTPSLINLQIWNRGGYHVSIWT